MPKILVDRETLSRWLDRLDEDDHGKSTDFEKAVVRREIETLLDDDEFSPAEDAQCG